jgi:hypothetical protein
MLLSDSLVLLEVKLSILFSTCHIWPYSSLARQNIRQGALVGTLAAETAKVVLYAKMG